jgi:hypothetical protein
LRIQPTLGDLILPGDVIWPNADGTNLQVLSTDGLGNLTWVDQSGTGGSGWDGISGSVPELGGNLNAAGFTIYTETGSGLDLMFDSDTSRILVDDGTPNPGAVTVESAAAKDLSLVGGTGVVSIGGTGPAVISTETSQPLSIEPDGDLSLKGLVWPNADGTAGQVLATDGSGNLSFTTGGSGGGTDWNFTSGTSPKLGGNLDVTGFEIYTEVASTEDIVLNADSGNVVFASPLSETTLTTAGTSHLRIAPAGDTIHIDKNMVLNTGVEMLAGNLTNIIRWDVTPPSDPLFPNVTFVHLGEDLNAIDIHGVIFQPVKIKNDTAIQGYNAAYTAVQNLISIDPNDYVIVGDGGTAQTAIRSENAGLDPLVRQGTFGLTTDYTIIHEGNLDLISIGDLNDVDITTTAPTVGQVLEWDGTNFVPQSISGTITGATNLTPVSPPTSQGEVFKQNNAGVLEFRTLVAGTGVTISELTNAVQIDASGAGGGEDNTASNLGTGAGVYATKSGVDLQFKSLVMGSGVTITETATEITINSTAAAPIIGEIKAFVGSPASLPFGWHVADGTNGTINLQDRTIFGQGTNFPSVGVGGGSFPAAITTTAAGSHSHTLSVDTAGAHTHSLTINSGGDHSHTATTASAGNHSHTTGSVTLTSAQIPNHAHPMFVNDTEVQSGTPTPVGFLQYCAVSLTNNSGSKGYTIVASNPTSTTPTLGATGLVGSSGSHNHGNTSTTGAHTHTVSVTTSGSAHSHTGSAASNGNHTHTGTSNTVSSHTHTVTPSLPPYLVAYWIQYTGA